MQEATIPPGTPFTVEAGKVREVVNALRSRRGAQSGGTTAIDAAAMPAPLIFTRTTVFQETPGSTVFGLLGVDPTHMRHAGHAWTQREPLYAGRTYTVTPWSLAGEETKHNRAGGRLRFVTAERNFFAAGGRPVISERMITVIVGPAAASPQGRASSAATPSARIATKPASSPPLHVHADWRNAAPGTELARLRIAPLTRTHFVRFAGAIGDFNPIHHDPDVAHRSGLADVIAMGTLPLGHALAAMEQGYGQGPLTEVEVRFYEPLYPGQALDLIVQAAADSTAAAPHALIDLRTEAGTRIITGGVRARPA